MEPTTTVRVSIPRWEWEAASQLVGLVTVDERSRLGQVRLSSDGSARRWCATDSYRLIGVAGGSDQATYDVGVPVAMIRHAIHVCDGDEVVFELGVGDGVQLVTVEGPGGRLTVEDLGHDFPDLERYLAPCEQVAGSATVTSQSLYSLLRVAMTPREPVDDTAAEEFPVPFWLAIIDGSVTSSVSWPEVGDTRYTMHASTAQGDVMVQLNPHYLRSLLAAFAPEDEVTLEIPRYSSEPIRLRTLDRWAALMPLKTAAEHLRSRTETVIEEACGHLAVVRDGDGDYPLRRHSVPIYGRLEFGEPDVFQVFSVVLSGIDAGPELHAELNDLNSNLQFARLFHVNGQILAEVDLVAETLDAGELDVAIGRIGEVALEIMPTLAAVLGGELVGDPAEARRALYRNTVIDAEVSPGAFTTLSGSLGTAVWPFPGVVHVITGWNPQGVVLDDEFNSDINIRIAEDILRHGGRFVHGHGRSPDGKHVEPSIVAWGLSRDEAVRMGRRAKQDSIFEIDADAVRLVSCIGTDVDEWPRIP